ncbi:MAG: hypothetical protein HQK49_09915 [Oligoflexia bacterium]|nr:hypothetical protein [Oligoflexia bacterium]
MKTAAISAVIDCQKIWKDGFPDKNFKGPFDCTEYFTFENNNDLHYKIQALLKGFCRIDKIYL